MKKKVRRFMHLLLAFVLLTSIMTVFPAPASAGAAETLSSLTAGTTISFAGHIWILLDPGKGYLILRSQWVAFDYYRAFDPDKTIAFDPNDTNNIAFFLNNDPSGVYGSMSPADQALIQTHGWTGGASCKIGLISSSEFNDYKGYITPISGLWWTLTPSTNPDQKHTWSVSMNQSDLNEFFSDTLLGVRPTLYLDPDIQVSKLTMTTPVYYSQTGVNGTAEPGSSVVLSINGTAQPTVTADATTGDWSISGLTLVSGDLITVTANPTGIVGKAVVTKVISAAVPNFVTQPQDTVIITGNATCFSVAATASDGGTLSYQWQKSLNGTGPFIDISGATSTSYTNLTKEDIRSRYRCAVSNTFNGTITTAYSTAVTLRANISNTYTVTFRDWDGTVLKTQTLHEGGRATAPGNPLRAGYAFNGWDTAYDFIINDLTVTARYTERAPGPVGTGSITGRVVPSHGLPVSGINVSMMVDGAVYSTTADTAMGAGYFTLTGVPEGSGYTMTFSKSGFVDEIYSGITVTSGATTTIYEGVTIYYPLGGISAMNSQSAIAGQTVTFRISITEGKAPFICQWKRDGVIVATHNMTSSLGYGGTDSLTVTASEASRGNYTATLIDAHGDIAESSTALSLTGDIISYRSGFGSPDGIAVDSSGNIIFSSDGGTLKMLKTDGTVVPLVAENISGIVGQFVMDNAGNIYYIGYVSTSNGLLPAVKKMSPDGSGGYTATVLDSANYSELTGIAVDGSGNVYVTDMNNYSTSLRKISPNLSGGYVTTPINGVFTNPAGVAVDGSGNLYVANYGNNSVNKLLPNASGGYDIISWGSGFASPWGLAADSAGNVYVADYSNSAVKRINTSGTVDRSWSIKLPTGITLDSSGNVYVTGCEFSTVTKIIPADNTVAIQAFGLGNGSGVAVDDGGNIYVADPGNWTGVSKMIAGGVIDTLISRTDIINPYGIAVDGSGNVYAANSGGSGIKKVAADKTVVTLAPGLSSPRGVAVDGDGYVYATAGSTVKKISPDGSTVTDFASGFNIPKGVAVDSDGYVYVTDIGNKSVKKFSPDGNIIAPAYSDFKTPNGIAVDRIGNIYVADTGDNAVKKIGTDGIITVIDSLDPTGNYYGAGGGNFNTASGIAVDSTGKLYVTGSFSGVKIFQQYFGVNYNVNGNNGGSAPADATNYVYGQTATVLGNTGSLTKSGFSFNGWNTKPDGSGTAYAEGDEISMSLKDITLYAQWKLNVNTAPARKSGVAATTTASVTVNTAYTLDLSNIFEDVNADTLTYKVSVNGAATTEAGARYSYTPTSSGITALVFKANDGKVDSTDTYTVTLTANAAPPMNTAPVRKSGVAATTAASVTVNTAYTLNLATIFEDVNADTLTYKVSVNSAATIGAAASYSYTPTASGITTLVFKANDGTVDSTDTFTVTLTANAAPPVNMAPVRKIGVAATTAASVTVNTAYTLNLASIFEDANADILTYKVSVNGAATTVAAASYSYTPTASGITTLVFKANDGTVDSTDTYTVTLTANAAPPVNMAPVRKSGVAATTTASVTVNTAYTLDLATIFEDVNADTLTYKVSVNSAATTGAAVSYTYTPTASGITTLVFKANDGTVDSTDTYTVTLTANARTYSLTITAGTGGSIITGNSSNYTEGAIITIAASAAANYSFNQWTVIGGGNFANANSASTTFTMPATAAAITASFTFSGGGGSSDNGSGSSGSNGGGGGSSSSGGSGSVGGNPPSTSTYNADIEAENGAETTLPVTVNKDGGSASIDVGTKISLGSGRTVVTIPSIPGVDTYSVGIPVSILSTVGGHGSLTLDTDAGSITIPSNMLTGVSGISGSKTEITIGEGNKSDLPKDAKAAIGDRPLVQLTLSVDGKLAEWNNPNAPVVISIPYKPTAAELANPESIVIWYIDGSGRAISVPNGHYDPVTGTVTFTTTHFSFYAVGFNKVSFNDTPANAWYKKAVGFIAARGITTGAGGNYSPTAKLTRADLLVMLMRAYDIAPDATSKNNFADAGNTYYTGYLATAKRLGISGGIGSNMYAPDKVITRQEMFTLLYNVLKRIGRLPEGKSGKSISNFSDAGQIASWAKDAMTLLVQTGTIDGNAGKLAPTGTTTRAEIAQVLYNLLGK